MRIKFISKGKLGKITMLMLIVQIKRVKLKKIKIKCLKIMYILSNG
jgi:hypothetical protein